jgi:hypothetical protein
MTTRSDQKKFGLRGILLAAALVALPGLVFGGAAYAATTIYYNGASIYDSVHRSPTGTIKGSTIYSETVQCTIAIRTMTRNSTTYQVYHQTSGCGSSVNYDHISRSNSHNACYWDSTAGYTSGTVNLDCYYKH